MIIYIIEGDCMDTEKSPLTDEELLEVLKEVRDRIAAEVMEADNITGRTITIDNQNTTKRSGGIMISKKENADNAYIGTYYSFEEFMTALDELMAKKSAEMTSTFKRKTTLKVDSKAVAEALKEYSSLVIEKQGTSRNADTYVVSRSDPGSDTEKRTGGIFTPVGMPVKEGRYIDRDTAKRISDGVIAEKDKIAPPPIYINPTPGNSPATGKDNNPGPDVVQNPPGQGKTKDDSNKENNDTPVASTFEKKGKVQKLSRLLSEVFFAIPFVPTLLIPTPVRPKYVDPTDIPPAIEITVDTDDADEKREEDIPTTEKEEPEKEVTESVPENKDNPVTVRNGDIIYVPEGTQYDHTSLGNDRISGTVGENPYREPGEYKVNIVVLIDAESGEWIDGTYEEGEGELELLAKNGLTVEDVKSGKIIVKYHISKGRTDEHPTGWVPYDPNDPNSYQKVGSVAQKNPDTYQGLDTVNEEQGFNQGGKSK